MTSLKTEININLTFLAQCEKLASTGLGRANPDVTEEKIVNYAST